VVLEMPSWSLRRDDAQALLRGVEILGTGGGGSSDFGQAIMDNDFQQGRSYELVKLGDLSADALVVSGGIMGSVKALHSFRPEEIVRSWERQFEPMVALRAMERHLGRTVDAIVPFELGGLNTPVMLSLAARSGIPVIDGDGLGRAAPETQMTSFIGHGVAVTPMPLVDWKGNIVVVADAVTPFFPDEIGRFIVTSAGGLGANAHYPMSGAQAREAVIPDSITLSLELGRRLEGIEEPQATVGALQEMLNGKLAFVGEVSSIKEEDALGFLVQTATIQGTGVHSGHEVEIVMKNEFMMASLDGRPGCVFPDLIMLLDNYGHGMMSSEMEVGQRAHVVLAPCHERLREAVVSSIGRVALGASRFGRPGITYEPVETLSTAWGIPW